MSDKIVRSYSEELDNILGLKIPVLDHGYVRPVDYIGNQQSILNAARISYGKGTKSVTEDRGLLRYLIRHHHNTPLEMTEIAFEMQLPIFVARQLIRHRTANVNEYSARYSEMQELFYIPQDEHVGLQSLTNKQGKQENSIEDTNLLKEINSIIQSNDEDTFKRYMYFLSKNISREQARIVLPVNIYTKWIWKSDTNNLLKFLKLREDHHAQFEIRVYANAMASVLNVWMPDVYDAYVSYIRDAVHLSKEQFEIIKDYIKHSNNANSLAEAYNKPKEMSKREWDDLVAMFN